MVRHEAAEGLAALCVGQHGSDMEEAVLQVLQDVGAESPQEVTETCQVATARLRWQQQERDRYLQQRRRQDSDEPHNEAPFVSVDPAPPMDDSTNLSELGGKLLDRNLSLFDRYRAMFRLRNLGGSSAGAL